MVFSSPSLQRCSDNSEKKRMNTLVLYERMEPEDIDPAHPWGSEYEEEQEECNS